MLRRALLPALLAPALVLAACGGAADPSIFDQPDPGADAGTSSEDTGTPPADSGSSTEDTSVPGEDTDVPPPVDSGTPVDDTGAPPVDTGTPPVDTGTPPPVDSGVKCADGKLFGGHCYFVLTGGRNFSQARDACVTVGAHMATITSAEEQTFVSTVGSGERWIGLAIFSGSTSWRWVTGETVSYNKWAAGEPNRSGYCARLRTDGWADISCNDLFPVICERE